MILDTQPWVRQAEKPFTALVTGSLLDGGTGAYRHAFAEQRFDVQTGALSDAGFGRSGTTTRNYLTELSGSEIVAGTVVRAWLKGSVGGMDVYECLAPSNTTPTSYVTQEFDYTDDTFNYFYGNTVNFLDTAVFFVSANYSVEIHGPGYWYFDAPLIICGWQFWCSIDAAVASSALIDWPVPSSRGTGEATVFNLIATGDFALHSILPVPLFTSSQKNGPRAADGGDPIDGPVWQNPANASATDLAYATVSLPFGETTASLGADDYGFAVPADATVVGVEVTLRRGKRGAGVVGVTSVTLSTSTATTATKTDLTDWPLADGDLTLGGPTDTWTGWTAAEINDPLFRVRVRATEDGTGPVELRVDSVLVRVYYTLDRDGQVIALHPLGGKMLLVSNSVLGAAGAKLALEGNTDKVVLAGGMALLWYDRPRAVWASFRQDDFDERVKIDNSDTTAGHLADKLVAGTNITLTVENVGGNEDIRIDAAAPAPGTPAIAHGEVVLNGSYPVASATWADTGLNVTIPSAGTWLIEADVSANVLVSGAVPAYVSVRLWDVTNSAEIQDTTRVAAQAQVTGLSCRGNARCSRIITTAGAVNVRLEAEYTSTGMVLTANVVGTHTGAEGGSLIRYWQLG